ncbi:hypothetical protein HLPR_06130 [Helicovermis profundi]|uniref:GAF domain-containing protein n=2 Tax=Helicovermis profundi TaxID=3065157 RepID=A0AAU9E6K7_9FIRM|nr:hypothetical protein HLPR_06130 [Clostridia bacterium S502]
MNTKKIFFSILENIIFIAIVILVFYILPYNKESFLTLNIHPLFFVVLIMALRYGSAIGLISAFFVSLTYSYIYFTLGKDMFLLFSELSNSKYFVYFFIIAIVIGRFKDNFLYHEKISDNKINLLKEANQNLTEANKEAFALKEELRKQIIGAEHSILSLYEIASSLDTLDPEEVYTETMGMLSKFLRAKTISIYSVNETKGVLRLKIRLGEGSNLPNSIFYEDNESFYELINKKNIVKHIYKSDDNCPLMCAPLIDDGKVVAILNIEMIEFKFVTDYTYNVFKIIVEWVNKALIRALSAEEDLRENEVFQGTNILFFSNFIDRLDKEEHRKEKFNIEYILLSYYIKNPNLEYISKKSLKILRDVDIVGMKCNFNFIDCVDKKRNSIKEINIKMNNVSNKIKKYNLKGNVFFLLPATPMNQKDHIEERILSTFDYKLEKTYEIK